MAHAYVVGTFDTKGDELRYVADLIRDAGHEVTTVDVGTSDAGARRADVTAADVAGPDAFTGDRGTSVAAMAQALERWLPGRTDLDGVIGLGGSGGTALITLPCSGSRSASPRSSSPRWPPVTSRRTSGRATSR